MEGEVNYHTVTFKNRYGLTLDEITREFGQVGEIPKVREVTSRVFVGFQSRKMAEKALRFLTSKYSDLRGVREPRRRSAPPAGFPRYSDVDFLRRYRQSPAPVTPGPSGESSRPRNGVYEDFPRYSVVIANLPSRFKQEDIKDMLREVRPKIINKVSETRVCEIKYCHILVPSKKTVDYVIKKLGGLSLYDAEIMVIPTDCLVNMKMVME